MIRAQISEAGGQLSPEQLDNLRKVAQELLWIKSPQGRLAISVKKLMPGEHQALAEKLAGAYEQISDATRTINNVLLELEQAYSAKGYPLYPPKGQ